MEYKTLLLPITQVDEEMNALAKQGWILHSQSFFGMQQYGEAEPTPLILTCMQKRPEDGAKTTPDRSPIGLGRKPA